MSPRKGLHAVLYGALVLILLLLGVFAYSLADSQHKQRRDMRKRFHDRAAIEAALTQAIFSISAMQSRADLPRRFGGRTIDAAALARSAREGQLRYAAIYDGDGRLLAATPGFPRAAARPNLQRALRTGDPELSNVRRGPGRTGVVEWAVPFETRQGQRVQVSGINQRVLNSFLSGFLTEVPELAKSDSFVVDSRRIVLGSTGRGAPPGAPLPDRALARAVAGGREGDYGSDRFFTSAPIKGAPWDVVLSASRGELYSSIGGFRGALPWIVFAAFALVAGVGLFLARRVLIASSRLERVELSRRHALEINDNIVQRLAVAKYELDRGDTEASRAKLAETLREAQHLVTGMLEEREITPGALRRAEPADTERPVEPAGPRGAG